MEKFKGTQGPWMISNWKCADDCCDKGYMISNGVYTTAYLSDDDDRSDNFDNTKANANLIAAAPDLLEALINIVSNTDPFHSALEVEHHADGVELYNNARAAIARALGKNDGEE